MTISIMCQRSVGQARLVRGIKIQAMAALVKAEHLHPGRIVVPVKIRF